MQSEEDRIVRVDGYEVECSLPETAGNALRVFNKRGALLVRLTSASGAVGWGETWAFPGAASAFIRDLLAPKVIGRRGIEPHALQAALLPLVVPDRRGQGHMAVSAIDIACWDLRGQISSQSIASLMGGGLRQKVRAYASGPLLPEGPDRYVGFADELERYAAAGFTAFKIRVGISLSEDEIAIRTAREILGPDALLMVDMNEASTSHDAITLANRVSDCKLGWVEEPLPHDDLPGYRKLAERMPVPLSGGESFCGVQAFRESLCQGALDIIQPDVALCGGLTEAMRISALADAFGVQVAPHVWGTGLNMLATLQYCAMLSERRGSLSMPLFEYDMSYNPLREAIFTTGPDADGMIAIPDGPGLGKQIEESHIDSFITNHWIVE
tara:strand:- start:4176 stop:5327 length:1152 start_codon:yes stop_codon:yes gene_type:complete